MNRSTIIAYTKLLQNNVAFFDAINLCKRVDDSQLPEALKQLFENYKWLNVNSNSDINWNLLAKTIKILAESWL